MSLCDKSILRTSRFTTAIYATTVAAAAVVSGNYDGPEPQRLATLKLAAIKGAPYVDVEFKAAALFFAGS